MQSQKPTKWYKVIRRGADPIYIEQDKLEAMLNDPQQLIKYYVNQETWRVFNKADIVDAYFDKEYSMKANEIKFSYFKDNETGKVVQLAEGTLPEDSTRYTPV